MGMVNCTRCGRLFNQIRVPICSRCEKEEEDDFQKVKEYIQEFPGSTMSEVSNETRVAAKRIQKFLRDGRLEVTKGLQGMLTCNACGTAISTGKLCNSCSAKIEQQVQDVVTTKKAADAAPKKSSGSRMHIVSDNN